MEIVFGVNFFVKTSGDPTLNLYFHHMLARSLGHKACHFFNSCLSHVMFCVGVKISVKKATHFVAKISLKHAVSLKTSLRSF